MPGMRLFLYFQSSLAQCGRGDWGTLYIPVGGQLSGSVSVVPLGDSYSAETYLFTPTKAGLAAGSTPQVLYQNEMLE